MSWRDYTGYAREGLAYLESFFAPKRHPLTKFVIITVGRTGSDLLVNLLHSHPNIHCNSELLRRRVASPSLYIKCKEMRSKKEIYGFKLVIYHFEVQKIKDPGKFVSNLFQAGYMIISVKRKNILRQAISHMYAIHRNKFHERKTSTGQQIIPMKIDIKKLISELNLFSTHLERENKILEKVPVLQLYYEDDLVEEEYHQNTMDKISKYLGIQTSPVHTDLIRTTPKDLTRIIENFTECREYLKHTEFAQYLES